MDQESRERRPIIVYPSEIHHFAYCPRQYFFSLYLPQPRPLGVKIRLLLGRIYHALLRIPASLRGYRSEETLETRLGDVILRGRPDSYKKQDDVVEIVERKSGRGPRRGVWLSDMLQVTAYGIILRNKGEKIILKIEYRGGKSRSSTLDSRKVTSLISIIDDIVLVKKYGIVPYANRSPRRCVRCPYRSLCEELDRELDPGDGSLYEPGSQVGRGAVDESFR